MLIDSLYTKEQIQYVGNSLYRLPDGTQAQGEGISKFLYEKRLKSDAMRQGISVHSQVENNLRESDSAIAILDWMDDNLQERKSEVFVYGEHFNKSLIGYADCIAYKNNGELTLIDVKTTSKPVGIQEGSTKWFVQCISYVLSIHQMTGVLIPNIEILAINPDTNILTVHNKGITEYSQLSMVLKSYLT